MTVLKYSAIGTSYVALLSFVSLVVAVTSFVML